MSGESSTESLREAEETFAAEQAKNKIRSLSLAIRLSGLFDTGNRNLRGLSGDILALFREEKHSSVRSVCAWVLGRLCYLPAFDDLVQGLWDEDRSVRIWSAWALGELGLEKATKPLIEAQAREHVSNVRRAMGGALKKIRLEPTRVHKKQVLRGLQPPPCEDRAIMTIVRKLETLKWTKDGDEIVALREQISNLNPSYFKRYMQWLERKPILENTLIDNRKSFSTDE